MAWSPWIFNVRSEIPASPREYAANVCGFGERWHTLANRRLVPRPSRWCVELPELGTKCARGRVLAEGKEQLAHRMRITVVYGGQQSLKAIANLRVGRRGTAAR
jgi:hypothetical protein